MKNPAKGFTLFELIVVVCIVSLLAAALLKRVGLYQEQAEKAAMEQVAAAVQSALTLQYASLVTRGQEKEIEVLASENPMDWLAKKPANYAGEFFDPATEKLAPGSWVFDLKSRNLIYRVDRDSHFSPGTDGAPWVRYRVTLQYGQRRGGKTGTQLEGVLLEPAAPYAWFDRSAP